MSNSVIPAATGFVLENFDQKIQQINGQPISRSEKQNLYLQGVSIAAQQTAAVGGLGAVTAITASLAAAYAQTQVINEHLSQESINPTPEITKKLIGDELSLISDRVQTVGAVANLVPASKPLAVSLEELGSAADAIGLYISLPGYIKDLASVAGQQLLSNITGSINNALQYIENASLPDSIKQNFTDIASNISSLLNNIVSGNSTDADIANLEGDAKNLGANVVNFVNDYISSNQNIDVTQQDSDGGLQLSLPGNSSPVLTTGFDFQSANRNALTAFVYGDNSNSEEINVDRSGTESFSFYNDGVDGNVLTKQLFNYADGSSSVRYYANGASKTEYYSGESESGQLTGIDVERANGTSALTTFDSAGGSVTISYSGSEGSGDIVWEKTISDPPTNQSDLQVSSTATQPSTSAMPSAPATPTSTAPSVSISSVDPTANETVTQPSTPTMPSAPATPIPAALNVSISPVDPTANENAGTEQFTLTRTGDSSQAATVFVSTTDGSTVAGESANSNAFAPFVYQPVTFAVGSSTAQVGVTINDLGLFDGSTNNYGIQVTGNQSQGNVLATGQFSIINNDQAPAISISPINPTISENAGSEKFTLTRSGNASQAETVYVSTSDSPLAFGFGQELPNSGTASGSQPFAPFVYQPVTFAAGSSTASVNLNINDLGIRDGSTNSYGLEVTGSNASGSTALATSQFSIINNDTYEEATFEYTGHSLMPTSSNGKTDYNAGTNITAEVVVDNYSPTFSGDLTNSLASSTQPYIKSATISGGGYTENVSPDKFTMQNGQVNQWSLTGNEGSLDGQPLFGSIMSSSASGDTLLTNPGPTIDSYDTPGAWSLVSIKNVAPSNSPFFTGVA